jgi:hypothetical protein
MKVTHADLKLAKDKVVVKFEASFCNSCLAARLCTRRRKEFLKVFTSDQ